MLTLTPIEVRHYGTRGMTLVVLHGGPGAPGSAAGLAKSFADNFRVLEPLQRRSGETPLTVSQHVEDLRAVAPAGAIIVGWSWGAMLGLSFSTKYPERVARLVLVGCGTYNESSRRLYHSAIEDALGASGRQRVAALQDQLGAATDPVVRDRVLGALGATYMNAESCELLDEDSSGSLAADEGGHRETWNDVLRLQREGVEPAAFSRIKSPVLMIHGTSDPHPGPATRDVLRQFIPQLEYIELERCGHQPWRERQARARFVKDVQDWCEITVL